MKKTIETTEENQNKQEKNMKGQQHVHSEGQIPTIYFDIIGRSTRGNERDIDLLCKEIENTINTFVNGRIMHHGVGGWIDHTERNCC